MEILPIGKLIEADAKRDAIHIAIAPVIATERLAPGQHIELAGSGGEVRAATKSAIGIVDPFLSAPVFPNDRFYMFLYPNTVTSLRHQWTHPAFEEAKSEPADETKAESEKWMRDFAEKIDLSYASAVQAGVEYIRNGEYHIFHGFDTPDECYTHRDEYWRHLERITGMHPDEGDRDVTPFSCSC